MVNRSKQPDCAVWAITPKGLQLAVRIVRAMPGAVLLRSQTLSPAGLPACRQETFERAAAMVEAVFHRYRGHVFIMAAGIVVRLIGPLIKDKTIDPAVVVMDDNGRHAISLLSGHIGGANDLTQAVAALVGAEPVITTATDVNDLPAIDSLAVKRGLAIENPAAVKAVGMALLNRRPLGVHDPYGLLGDDLPTDSLRSLTADADGGYRLGRGVAAGVFVDDIRVDLPPQVLVLRPGSLTAGIGCNRHTPLEEMETLLREVFERHGLSVASLRCLASINLKRDEAGLLALARALAVPIRFFEKNALNRADGVRTPSAMAKKHIGVHSVCEAAAILASEGGALIVPKHRSTNATVAIARIAFT